MYEVIIYTLIISVSFCLFRVVRGPTAPDRVVAMDASVVLFVALISVLSLSYKSDFLIDTGMVYALLGFIGTLAVAKYLQGEKLGE